jgi:hypothetical protein
MTLPARVLDQFDAGELLIVTRCDGLARSTRDFRTHSLQSPARAPVSARSASVPAPRSAEISSVKLGGCRKPTLPQKALTCPKSRELVMVIARPYKFGRSIKSGFPASCNAI